MQITLDIPKEEIQKALERILSKRLESREVEIDKETEERIKATKMWSLKKAAEHLDVTYKYFCENIVGKPYGYREGSYHKKDMIQKMKYVDGGSTSKLGVPIEQVLMYAERRLSKKLI